jgi:integrase/recombinase XerD
VIEWIAWQSVTGKYEFLDQYERILDEIIFRVPKPRNRLILELMARGGMRISEVLKLTPADINNRMLTLKEPKSGREQEFIL